MTSFLAVVLMIVAPFVIGWMASRSNKPSKVGAAWRLCAWNVGEMVRWPFATYHCPLPWGAFRLSPRDGSRAMYVWRNWSPAETAVIKALVRPGDVVWDVGAGVGVASVLAARQGARVVACEPNDASRKLLERHARGLDITIVPYALSDTAGVGMLRGGWRRATGSLVKPGEELQQIEMVRGDYLEDLPCPTIVKIDVEGDACCVLKGMGKLLDGVRWVLVEIHNNREKEDTCSILSEWKACTYHEIEGASWMAFGNPRLAEVRR